MVYRFDWCSLWCIYNFITCGYYIINTTFNGFTAFAVFADVTTLITFARTCGRIRVIVFFRCTMFYWSSTLTLTLEIVHFLSQVTFPTEKFTSRLTCNLSWECPWFIYHFDHFKYFKVNVSYFVKKIYPTECIVNSVAARIIVVLTNNEWIVMKFIRIGSISLTMHGWLFMDIHFVDNDLQQIWQGRPEHQHHNKNLLLNEPRYLYNIASFHEIFENIFKIIDIDILIPNRKMVDLSNNELSFFHVIEGKVFWNISQKQWICFFYGVIYFELIDFYTVYIQKTIDCTVVLTQKNYFSELSDINRIFSLGN